MDGHSLFDYSVGLNDLIQILVSKSAPTASVEEDSKEEDDKKCEDESDKENADKENAENDVVHSNLQKP